MHSLDSLSGLANSNNLTSISCGLKGTTHPKQTVELINAFAFSKELGLSPTAHITIYWPLAQGFTESSWSKFRVNLMNRITKWIWRNGEGPPSFIWVNEKSNEKNGQSEKGCHTHIFIRCSYKLLGKLKNNIISTGYFKQYYGGSEALVIKAGDYGLHSQIRKGGVLAYLIKQTDREKKITVNGKRISLADELGLRIEDPSLPIRGKRCGVSQNLSSKARQTWGWVELRDPKDLVEHLTIKPVH